MENWIKQSFNQAGLFCATEDKSRFGILPGLILDFSLFPGLYISDELDISDNFSTLPAMARLNDEDEWEYEFIQAVAIFQIDSFLQRGEQVMLAYDDNGLYFHPLLAEKIQASPNHTRVHRKI